MLKLRELHLLPDTNAHLDGLQQDIDAQADYANQVRRAKSLWERKNKLIFENIRDALSGLCHGAQRCHYCEDSVGDEVEHVWPKSFYPSRAFKWVNFLYACGQCNGGYKRDQFAVFDFNGVVVELRRDKNAPVVPPPQGEAVFIDPHVDDPFELLELDLATGHFVPRAAFGELNYLRAEYTIRVLGLNKRDYLTKSRRNAFAAYLDSARQYVAAKAANANVQDLNRRVRDIAERHHPSVWNEIKRLATDAEYKPIFDAAPELLEI